MTSEPTPVTPSDPAAQEPVTPEAPATPEPAAEVVVSDVGQPVDPRGTAAYWTGTYPVMVDALANATGAGAEHVADLLANIVTSNPVATNGDDDMVLGEFISEFIATGA